MLGDVNGDGNVNYADINAFSSLLQGSALLEARRYEYDEENRLTAVKRNDPNETPLMGFAYDALGRRIVTTDYTDPNAGGSEHSPRCTPESRRSRSTFAVAQALRPVNRRIGPSRGSTSGAAASRNRFALIDHTALGDKDANTPEVLHYVRDELGNVVGLTDAGDPNASPAVAAKLVERYDYDPYGRDVHRGPERDALRRVAVRQPAGLDGPSGTTPG